MSHVERKVDDIGRIVIPEEYRKTLQIKNGDTLAVSLSENQIILTKKAINCCVCGTYDDITDCSGIIVCNTCRDKINSI